MYVFVKLFYTSLLSNKIDLITKKTLSSFPVVGFLFLRFVLLFNYVYVRVCGWVCECVKTVPDESRRAYQMP